MVLGRGKQIYLTNVLKAPPNPPINPTKNTSCFRSVKLVNVFVTLSPPLKIFNNHACSISLLNAFRTRQRLKKAKTERLHLFNVFNNK